MSQAALLDLGSSKSSQTLSARDCCTIRRKGFMSGSFMALMSLHTCWACNLRATSRSMALNPRLESGRAGTPV